MTLARYDSVTAAELKSAVGPTPGAALVRDTILWWSAVGGVHVSSGGIFNKRSTNGKALTVANASLHAVGRACDLMVPDIATGQLVAYRCLVAGEMVGLSEVIFNRTRWTRDHPGGAPYNGLSPHTDHVHLGFTRQWARDAKGPDYGLWAARALGYLPG